MYFLICDRHFFLSSASPVFIPQALQSDLMFSHQVFLGRPLPRAPATSMWKVLLMQPSLRSTWPYQRRRRHRRRSFRGGILSLWRRDAELTGSDHLTWQTQRIIDLSLRKRRARSAAVIAQVSLACNMTLRMYMLYK